MFERSPVTSSVLASVGYDPETAMLEIEFNSGAVYQYQDVPASVYRELVDAPSKGTYLNTNLKEGGYTYSRVR